MQGLAHAPTHGEPRGSENGEADKERRQWRVSPPNGDRFSEGRIIVAAVGHAPPARDCGQSTQAGKAHEARDSVVPVASAGSPQGCMDAWRTVPPTAFRVRSEYR